MKRCTDCGGIGRSYTEQSGFILTHCCTCYIKCTNCGKRTSTHTAYWASDARKAAEKEWEQVTCQGCTYLVDYPGGSTECTRGLDLTLCHFNKANIRPCKEVRH